MPKYADWSPASVFGAMAAAPRVSQELVMAHSGASRLKTKPGKADLLFSPPPAVKAVNNNDEQLEPQETKQQASEKMGPSRDLAAQILQRYGRMWLLRRHETQRLREVERLRGALRTAAIRVVTKSCVLYVKRRAIHDYLDHLTAFEARLDGLLGQVIVRKRRKEEERRLAVIHRQRVQRIEEQKRQVVRSWLAIRIEESWRQPGILFNLPCRPTPATHSRPSGTLASPPPLSSWLQWDAPNVDGPEEDEDFHQ
ncbi:hypothetical protein BBJ28_00007434 [Nothophytophthora sp. Chile5]|nr:hypothetical protein BBJ28_00007434 [Nothophytophthora sp. Chile5]